MYAGTMDGWMDGAMKGWMDEYKRVMRKEGKAAIPETSWVISMAPTHN